MSRRCTPRCIVAVTALWLGCGRTDSEIVRISRQNNSGTYAYFRESVVGEDGELKLGSLDLSGSKDVVEMVAATPNAIGYSGMGYATPRVKMLPLRRNEEPAVAPSAMSVRGGKYPLARPLYIYVVGEPQGILKHFLSWVLSEPGQVIVEELGYIPVEQRATEELPDPPAGSIKIAGSDTMVNLAQAWAERYSQEFPNVRPEVSGGGTGVGIAKLIEGTVQLANASREMKGEEKRLVAQHHGGTAVREFIVALDAIAVFVHPSNPVEFLGMDDLAGIFGEGGTICNWRQIHDRRTRTAR